MSTKWFSNPDAIRAFGEWDESKHPRDDKGQFTESGREAHPREVKSSPGYKLGLVIDTATKMAAKSTDPNAFSAIARKIRELPVDVLEQMNREHTAPESPQVQQELERLHHQQERAKEDKAVVAYLRTPKEKRIGLPPRIVHRAAEQIRAWVFGKRESEHSF